MKLRNKKTGKIGNFCYSYTNELCVSWQKDDGFWDKQEYKSLAELNKDWEDAPEEPKEHWEINTFGDVERVSTAFTEEIIDELREIGNYFGTREEAELAVKRLKAFKRLKDKGFRFEGWEDLQAEMGIDDLMLFNRDVINTGNVIGFRMDDYHDCIKDLDICFGGEE